MLKSGPHYLFLASCLAGLRPTALACLENPAWNWDTLLEIASEELVLPALHIAIDKAGLRRFVPLPIATALEGFYELNLTRNQALWKELVSVTTLLAQASIPYVLLKGTAYLAYGVWQDNEYGSRYLADIDLLLPLSDIKHAARILQDHGFLVDEKDQLGSARHHHPPLIRPGGFGVELHSELGTGIIDRLLAAKQVWNNVRTVSQSGYLLPVPSPEHLATHLIAHSQLHHPYVERIWPPLRALEDLHRLHLHFGEHIRWPLVADTFARVGLDSIYWTHMRTANSLLNTSVFAQKYNFRYELRWLHRKLHWRWDWFRFVDPIYAWQTLIASRLRFLALAWNVPGAWKLVLQAPFRKHFYRRLWTDLFHR